MNPRIVLRHTRDQAVKIVAPILASDIQQEVDGSFRGRVFMRLRPVEYRAIAKFIGYYGERSFFLTAYEDETEILSGRVDFAWLFVGDRKRRSIAFRILFSGRIPVPPLKGIEGERQSSPSGVLIGEMCEQYKIDDATDC